MSNTDPTIVNGVGFSVDDTGDTVTFGLPGNPNIQERIEFENRVMHYIRDNNETETFVYGYVDTTTNTFIHSHPMERKRGKLL